jgi:hypothetical protein
MKKYDQPRVSAGRATDSRPLVFCNYKFVQAQVMTAGRAIPGLNVPVAVIGAILMLDLVTGTTLSDPQGGWDVSLVFEQQFFCFFVFLFFQH